MIIQNFRHKKLQTVLIFLIILLCSMLLTSSVSILISLDKPFQDFAEECQSPSAYVFPQNLDDNGVYLLGKQFSELNEIQRVEYKKFHYISEELLYNGKKLEGFYKLTEYNPKINKNERYLEGSKAIINTLPPDECILPACVSNEYNIHTGDNIVIKLSGRTLQYTVRGVYSDPYNTSTAFDSDILVKQLPTDINYGLHIALYTKEGIKGSQIEDAFRTKNNGMMYGNIQTLQQRIENGLIVGNIIGSVFLATGIIMLLVSCLIISFMIRNAIITDAKTIAVYKTIGYTSRDILKMYLSFYFLIVSVACILGIGSSVFISNIILKSIFENMGEVSANSTFIPGVLCYLIIGTIVIGLIYMIINKAKSLRPVAALSGVTENGTQKRKNFTGNSKLQFSPLGITIRNITRNKRGALSTILTAILTIFSVNFAVISLDMANTMKENNDFWLGIDKSDVLIEVTDNTQFDKVLKTIIEDKRVNHFFKNKLGDRVSIKWREGINVTAMDAFVYDDFKDTKLPVVRGRNPINVDEIAISTKIAASLNKEMGDYLEIYLNSSIKVRLLITGIFQTYYQLGDCCRLLTDTYKQNNGAITYSNISVYLNPKENSDFFVKDIQQKINGRGNVIARTEAFGGIMNMIVRPQKNAIPPVTALILLIGAINIFCIVMLKNAVNQKINGIYKCIGYTSGHLILSNIYYVAMIAVSSMAVAIPMILKLYPVIMKSSLSMFGFLEYPVSYNLWHIVISNIGVVIMFVISTLISSRSLKNIKVRDLVQE